MTVGDTLKKVRLENDYSQTEVAKKLFVSRQTISNWELSKTFPDIEKLLAISELYGLSLDSLLKEDSAMTAKLKRDAKELKQLKKHKRKSIWYSWLAAYLMGVATFVDHYAWLCFSLFLIVLVLSFYHDAQFDDTDRDSSYLY